MGRFGRYVYKQNYYYITESYLTKTRLAFGKTGKA